MIRTDAALALFAALLALPLFARPGEPAVSRDQLAVMRKHYEQGIRQQEKMESYIVRLRRREVIGAKQKPDETLTMALRQKPYSVYVKWLGPGSPGREMVFTEGKFDSKLQLLTAAGDIPLVNAGHRLSFDPDGLMMRSSNRHHVTQIGFGATLQRIDRVLTALEQGRTDAGNARPLGRVVRPEFDQRIEAVEQIIPPKQEPHLPDGGRRELFMHPELYLPTVVVTYDAQGRQVEYYHFDRFQYPVALDDADFDPDRLWGKKGSK